MNSARLLILCAALAGCAIKPVAPPQPSTPQLASQAMRLTRVSFADLPGWNAANLDAARSAFRKSCAALMGKPDDAPMGGAGYGGAVRDWRGVCAMPDMPDFFAANFTPYQVLDSSEGSDGLFTGYYEAQISASRTRHGIYQTPVFGIPPDLVRADLGAFIPKLKGEHISGRVEAGKLVPYADRGAIEAGAITAPILFYAADPIAFFFLQIQGSGRVTLEDGTTTRIAYAGENGRAYTAIGRTLIAQGELTRETVSLQTIRAWLIAHPDKARGVMQSNASFVFFREAEGAGAQGTALTPLGSLAVDLRLHALAAPFYVAADGRDPVHTLLIAQDTGGAIRGAVRGDIFFGAGADAEARAGKMKAPGRLYVLLPNALVTTLGDGKAFAP